MARQDWSPLSFNGNTVDGSSNILMEFPSENSPYVPGGMDPIEATIAGRGLSDVGGQPRGATWQAQITLTASDETNVLDMMKVFNERDGLVYLRAGDGLATPTLWRIACRVIGPPEAWPGTRDHFWVTLRVPSPVWEEDSATTDNQANKTTSPIALGPAGVMANDGDRDTSPVFTINVDASKGEASALDDYAYSMQVIMVNRAPNDLDNVPVWLFDQSGAAGRLAVNSAAAGLAVQRTDISNQINLGGGITATAVTIPVDTAVGGGLPATGGIAYIIDGVNGDEQIYYTANSAGNLTGVVRGIGGTTGVIHPDNAVIRHSTTLKNGDDVRVTLDDVPNVNRWLAGNGPSADNYWNGTACDVVIVASFKRGIILTATGAATASVPATGGSITFKESLALLPQADGYVIWQNEVIYYATRDDHTISGIVRAAWGTTAATHATSAPVYANPRRAIVQAGYAKAGAPPSPPAERPCMQLNGSSNQTYKYGNATDDPSTVYYDPDNPNRPMMWRPGFDLDGNTVSPLMSLSAYGTIVTFKDDVPGDGNPPYNNLELTVPQGILKSSVLAIQNDWTPAAEILNLELFTRDAQGTLKLQDQLQQSAAVVSRDLPAALGNLAYGVKLKGRYNIAAGFRGEDATVVEQIVNASNSETADGAVSLKIVLEANSVIKRIKVRMAKAAAGTQAVQGSLRPDSGNAPDANKLLKRWLTSGVNDAPLVSGTAQAFYDFPLPKAGLYKAGTYWLTLYMGSGFAAVNVYGYTHGAQDQELLLRTGGVWQLQDDDRAWCYAISDYSRDGSAILNADQPVAVVATELRTSTIASFDNTEITLCSTPPQFIYVHRLTAFVNGATAGNMHHLKGVFESSTTGESGTLDLWLRPGGICTIDCDARSVTATEDAIVRPVGRAYDGDFITLIPGNNTVTLTDPSLKSPGQIDVASEWRGRKV